MIMAKDMTAGRITPILIKFTIPLVLGNIFQLLYNAVDSIIVGRYVGTHALAAVGACNPLVTLIILFIGGLCMGAGILMGMHYGAGDYDKLSVQLSSTMIGGLIFTAAVSVLCIFMSPLLLAIMKTDRGVMNMAVSYLRIIFAGLVFTFIYNFYASVLRALGDSKSPLYFLVVSSALNIFGDLFFVKVLEWGSNGCALSTVISEGISCLLCMIYIKFRVPALCLGKNWFKFSKEDFIQSVRYGWVSAMQQATVQLGKLWIQMMVNTMGVAAMAAFAAVNRIDDFAYVPQQNIGHAMTAFMAQNHGAGEEKRVREGFRCGMRIEAAYSIAVCLVCFIYTGLLMRLFVEDSETVRLGSEYLRLIACMYLLPAITNGIQGYFRGIGELKVTLLSSLVNMGVRVFAALSLVFFFKEDMTALPLAYMAGWFAMLLAEVPLLIRRFRSGSV